MKPEAGIARSGDSLDNVAWDVTGQTYTPVQLSAASFAFDALFPPGTFMPPHIHSDQDGSIRVLDGEDTTALAGD